MNSNKIGKNISIASLLRGLENGGVFVSFRSQTRPATDY